MGHLQRGDVEAALKSATHVVEGELRIGGQEHFYMETNSARVVPKNEDGEMEVFIGTQHPAILQVTDSRFSSLEYLTCHFVALNGIHITYLSEQSVLHGQQLQYYICVP